LLNAARFPESQAEVLSQLAHHTWLQIGAKEARPLVEQALSVARGHDDKRNTAKALAILGLVLTFENNFVAARSTLEESKALFQQVNDTWDYAHAVMGLALGSLMQDDRATSLILHEEALAIFRELGDRYFQSAALRHIGSVRVKQGDLVRGIAALREALLLAQDLDSKFEIYAVIWSFAKAEQRAGNPARAVRLYWAAKNIAECVGAWSKEDDAEFEDNLVSCRAALDESAFAAAVEEGRAMTLEQAITCALENPE
jgi:tetratricopeptide (TPR) repeat protein